MMPAQRRPFLMWKRYALPRARTIAQANRAISPVPTLWTIASPIPLAEVRRLVQAVKERE